jgi:hypothetical protein
VCTGSKKKFRVSLCDICVLTEVINIIKRQEDKVRLFRIHRTLTTDFLVKRRRHAVQTGTDVKCSDVSRFSRHTWSYVASQHRFLQQVKVQVKVNLSHAFLTSALDGGERPLSRLGRFFPSCHWLGGWVDTRASLDTVERKNFPSLPLLGVEPQSSSP